MKKLINEFYLMIIFILLIIVISLILILNSYELNVDLSSLKSLVPIFSAFIGIIGTLSIQILFRKKDREKEFRKNLSMIKGKIELLLRKVEFFLSIADERVISETKKNTRAKIFRDTYFEFDLDKLINKIGESEEYFIDTLIYEDIKRINDLLLKIAILSRQITTNKDFEVLNNVDKVFGEKHNIYVYDELIYQYDEISKIKNQI